MLTVVLIAISTICTAAAGIAGIVFGGQRYAKAFAVVVICISAGITVILAVQNERTTRAALRAQENIVRSIELGESVKEAVAQKVHRIARRNGFLIASEFSFPDHTIMVFRDRGFTTTVGYFSVGEDLVARLSLMEDGRADREIERLLIAKYDGRSLEESITEIQEEIDGLLRLVLSQADISNARIGFEYGPDQDFIRVTVEPSQSTADAEKKAVFDKALLTRLIRESGPARGKIIHDTLTQAMN
ncbi:hypothetical protein [Nitratireductor sp. XY-223]|uniref:hypothetical protein n=1 Tax=Nitratireductor sp. XY-223 TaxID=2561926 RepID=UPI0010A9E60B|nr:hypothetical protein [Nitratireductor sp. XY-223]